MRVDLLVYDATQLVTRASGNGPKRRGAMANVGLIPDGAVAVTDGEIVAITVVETPSGQNVAPYWRLLDGTGNPALACGSLTTIAQRDCGSLPASGNPYRIEVRD